MDIHIKQKEIEVAIEDYIANQGINLVNKNVSMSFTAGRGGSGISADINIEEKKELKPTTLGTPTQRAEALAKAAAEESEISPALAGESIAEHEEFVPDVPEEPVVGKSSIFAAP
jgi:hypothetical protein